MKKLPKKASKLLKLALDNMRIILEKGIQLDMNEWSIRNEDGKIISVCMASAVLFVTLKLHKVIPDLGNYGYTLVGEANSSQIDALESIRQGKLSNFLEHLGLETEYCENKYSTIEINSKIEGWKEYDKQNPEEFFKQIEDLIKFLETRDL